MLKRASNDKKKCVDNTALFHFFFLQYKKPRPSVKAISYSLAGNEIMQSFIGESRLFKLSQNFPSRTDDANLKRQHESKKNKKINNPKKKKGTDNKQEKKTRKVKLECDWLNLNIFNFDEDNDFYNREFQKLWNYIMV